MPARGPIRAPFRAPGRAALALPLALALGLALSGCASLIGGKAPPFLLSLLPDQTPPTGRAQSLAPGETVSVLVPVVPAKLRTQRVPVQADSATIAYVKDAQWVEAPARLFQGLLSDTIAARTGRSVLHPDIAATTGGLELAGQLSEFGVDARTNEVVVAYQAVLTGPGAQRQQRFEAREPVAAVEPRAVADALRRAANRVAADVAAFVG